MASRGQLPPAAVNFRRGLKHACLLCGQDPLTKPLVSYHMSMSLMKWARRHPAPSRHQITSRGLAGPGPNGLEIPLNRVRY